MRILIACDKFKGSLSALEACQALRDGFSDEDSSLDLVVCPVADGGEGFAEAIVSAQNGRWHFCEASDALGRPIEARYGMIDRPDKKQAAVIEMAEASGLHRVEPGRRDVLAASSHGTGELIRAALDAGVRRIVLGLGGSATNDGGAGLLAALGVRFLDREGQELPLGGAALARLSQIDLTGLDTRLAQVEVMVAADVDNPLCGPRGASAVFGPQKGASPEQVAQLDEALGHYADVMAATLGEDLRDFPGVGAAGGLGFAARAVLRAGFRPGVELVAELSGLVEAMQGADLVITGEGRLDGQSLHGKTPVGVARLARTAGVPVIALAGSLGEGYQRLYAEGIGAAFSLAPGPLSLEQAMAEAGPELSARAADLARLWRIADDTRLSPVQ